ncbi:MAG: ABC transporter substrate-binding protein [Alistipes sp.]|nr:ABC transporter substrate-binding protein [Alistipes sp.]
MKYRYCFFTLILCTVFYGCGHRLAAVSVSGDTLYLPRYASGFYITEAAGGRVLNITDPWQGAEDVDLQVFLSSDGSPAPAGFTGVTIRVPVKKVVCMSSTYVAFISALDRTEVIRGISGGKYISDAQVREAFADGQIAEVGYDAALNFEVISAIEPDAVLAYGITGGNALLEGKLGELGIDLVYIGDYVEASPLGKAEWIVAFGYLLGQEDLALEIFTEIEQKYNALKNMVAEKITAGERPVVMLNSPYRDTWFVPGDRSYMVRLVDDAGGVYACAGVDSDQSRPVSLEEAYIKMLSSDVWIGPGQATTLAEVKADNPRFADTPPVTGRRVYNNNKRRTPEGGSDFWESGAVRPDIVLSDMVEILHPGLLSGKEDNSLYYFQRLE